MEALLQLTGLVTVETQEAIRVTIVDWKKKKPVKFRSLSEKLSRSNFFFFFRVKIKLLRFSLTLISNRKWNSMFFGKLAVDGEGERERGCVCV